MGRSLIVGANASSASGHLPRHPRAAPGAAGGRPSPSNLPSAPSSLSAASGSAPTPSALSSSGPGGHAAGEDRDTGQTLLRRQAEALHESVAQQRRCLRDA